MAIDLICGGLIALFMVLGYLSGFWMQLLRLAALGAAYWLSGALAPMVAPRLATTFSLTELSSFVVAVVGLFLLVYAVFSAIGWGLLRRRRHREVQGPAQSWDSVLGAAFAGLKTALLLLIVLDAVTLLEAPFRKQLAPVGLEKSWACGFAKRHRLLAGLHVPIVGDLQTLADLSTDRRLQQRIVKAPSVQRLLRHPKVQQVAKDPKILAAARRGDVSTLMADPRIDRLLKDPELRRLVEAIDLRSLARGERRAAHSSAGHGH